MSHNVCSKAKNRDFHARKQSFAQCKPVNLKEQKQPHAPVLYPHLVRVPSFFPTYFSTFPALAIPTTSALRQAREVTAVPDMAPRSPHGNGCVVTNSIRGGGTRLEKSIYTQISWQSRRQWKEMYRESLWQFNEVLVTCCSFPTVLKCDLGS